MTDAAMLAIPRAAARAAVAWGLSATTQGLVPELSIQRRNASHHGGRASGSVTTNRITAAASRTEPAQDRAPASRSIATGIRRAVSHFLP